MTQVVLFDLGGVIVDLSGMDLFILRHGLVAEEFRRSWLELGAGHDFESGRTSAEAFADAFLDQFELPITGGQFLSEFAEWPSGLLPGAGELVADLDVMTATLSNTNPIHWAADLAQHQLLPMFDRHFPSFQLGIAKPAPEIFERVIQLLGVRPDEAVFVDDNLVNVTAARRVGLTAFHTNGPVEARAALASVPGLSDSLA